MRVLLTSNASHVPPRGGSTRSNLIWLEHLAASGHECRIVAAAPESDTEGKRSRLERELADQQIGALASTAGGIPVHAVADPAQRPAVLRNQIADFRPDWVLVSSEDLGHVLLREAHRAAPGRVVYLAHTPQFFPFGPASWNPDPQGATLVKRSAGIVAIGRHTAAYIERHTGRLPAVIHPPIYGAGPFEVFGHSGEGLITMINPCAVKGVSIFLALARRLPHRRFAALE
ncbi:MAG: glycosyltransferase, partial [Bryobacteraceae bacterium]